MPGGERKIMATPLGGHLRHGFGVQGGRMAVRRPANLGGLEVRTACGLTIRDTADCQSALLIQTGVGRKFNVGANEPN